MTGSFLDTTIVVNISDPTSPDKVKSETCVQRNQPSETPYYALRELLAGYLQNLCDAHNAILASENPAEAMINLAHKLHRAGRKKDSILQAIMSTLVNCYTQDPKGGRDNMKQESLEYLELRINTIWLRARKPRNVKLVQSLSCLNDGRIEIGAAGELRAPNDSFNCLKRERCAAAAYMYDNKSDLTNMIEALHPNNLDDSIGKKQETLSRRKALKELQVKGAREFNKSRCRALGDAYFAAMCPPGKVVVTSNTKDFAPLCQVLKKSVITP